MNLFGKGKISDDDVKPDGAVIASINVEKVSRHTRAVRAVIADCNTDRTIYKCEYNTLNADLHAYYEAADAVKKYINSEDYVLDREIMTNVEIPFVETVSKGNRWGKTN